MIGVDVADQLVVLWSRIPGADIEYRPDPWTREHTIPYLGGFLSSDNSKVTRV